MVSIPEAPAGGSPGPHTIPPGTYYAIVDGPSVTYGRIHLSQRMSPIPGFLRVYAYSSRYPGGRVTWVRVERITHRLTIDQMARMHQAGFPAGPDRFAAVLSDEAAA